MFWKPAWRCARPFSSRTLRRQPTAQACSLVPPQMTGDICQHSTNLWLITVNSNNIAPPATLACSSAFQLSAKKVYHRHALQASRCFWLPKVFKSTSANKLHLLQSDDMCDGSAAL